jgi:predicted house-cleaning NTP pyrophosphatase (Maf/HAM1 superfamily)
LRQQLPLASQSLRRNNFLQQALRMLQVSPPPLAPQTTNQPQQSLSTQHALAVAADQPRHWSPESLQLMSCIRTAFQSNTHCPAEKDSYCLDDDR